MTLAGWGGFRLNSVSHMEPYATPRQGSAVSRSLVGKGQLGRGARVISVAELT